VANAIESRGVSIHEKIITSGTEVADGIENRGTAIYERIAEAGTRFGEVIRVHSHELGQGSTSASGASANWLASAGRRDHCPRRAGTPDGADARHAACRFRRRHPRQDRLGSICSRTTRTASPSLDHRSRQINQT
jgi:hypothetical protein